MEENNKEKIVLNPHGVAELLGISLPTTYALFKRKDFPSIKLSERRTVVSANRLRQWLDEQSVDKNE